MTRRPARLATLFSIALLLPAASLPLAAVAQGRDDYARQWPLTLSNADAGAYRVTLDAAVYRSASLASLDDVTVVNADGAPVPAAVLRPGQQLAQTTREVTLPWFPLPAGDAGDASDITQISERDADGRVRRIETRISDSAPAAARAPSAWLIDASAIDATIVGLDIDWRSGDPVDAAYEVEGSDDLRDWRSLQPRAQLLELTRDGRRLLQRHIALDGRARYLRLRPLHDQIALPVTGVRATVVAPVVSNDWQWLQLRGARDNAMSTLAYTFKLDGRFPIDRIDVDTDGNDASTWQLQSRDSAEAPWTTRAGPWLVFKVGGAAGRDRSAPRLLDAVTRDRYWRLASPSDSAPEPTLRLGYRPEVMVFVARGAMPYALLAGSARATREASPVTQLIDTMRSTRTPQWQPANAILGAPSDVSGASAMVPKSPQRDWKSWLLWAVLIIGALMVVGFAVSLLRKPAAD